MTDDDAFERQADAPSPGLLAEFWGFLRHHRKWWLVPIITALLLMGLIALVGGSPWSPFLYPFF